MFFAILCGGTRVRIVFVDISDAVTLEERSDVLQARRSGEFTSLLALLYMHGSPRKRHDIGNDASCFITYGISKLLKLISAILEQAVQQWISFSFSQT